MMIWQRRKKEEFFKSVDIYLMIQYLDKDRQDIRRIQLSFSYLREGICYENGQFEYVYDDVPNGGSGPKVSSLFKNRVRRSLPPAMFRKIEQFILADEKLNTPAEIKGFGLLAKDEIKNSAGLMYYIGYPELETDEQKTECNHCRFEENETCSMEQEEYPLRTCEYWMPQYWAAKKTEVDEQSKTAAIIKTVITIAVIAALVFIGNRL